MSTLKFNRWQSIDGLTRNAVLQVVSKNVTTLMSTTSTTFVDATDAFISITPTSATSAVLVNFNVALFVIRNAANAYFGVRLMRNDTEIYDPYTFSVGTYSLGFNATGATAVNQYFQYPIIFEDLPATTNEVTYKVQICMYQNTNSGTLYLNNNGPSTYLSLLEIAQ